MDRAPRVRCRGLWDSWGGCSGGFGLRSHRLLRACVLKGISSISPCTFLYPAWGVDPIRAGDFLLPPPPPRLLSGLFPGWIWVKCHFLVPKALFFLCALRAHCLFVRVGAFLILLNLFSDCKQVRSVALTPSLRAVI